jgi:uncharacterized protein
VWMLVGLVSDTHGYVDAGVCDALAGCERILHAGDVGEGVLEVLEGVAPVTAVRGNNDTTGRAANLPEVAEVEVGGRKVAVVHRLVDAPGEGWDVLVFGHCHKQHVEEVGGRLRVNPGAAGRRGFHRGRSVALLDMDTKGLAVRFVELGLRGARV